MADKKFYYKYIHLMYGHDTKFSKLLLDLFSNPENKFDLSEHIFITPYKTVYEDLRVYSNVYLDESGKNLYAKYYKCCHLLISHSGESLYRMILTPKKAKRKIVYRYWGGLRIGKEVNDNISFFQKIKNRVQRMILKWILGDFAAIGVGNLTDIIDLSRILKRDTKYYCLSYASNEYYRTVEEIKKKTKDVVDKEHIVNVLLGHRGTEENNHIELIEKLSCYDQNKFKLYIPLSYGNRDYIEKVEAYVEGLHRKNIVLVKKFMEFSEYAKFLSKMDITIFDGYTSYALGNIGILLFLNKTIYLNENGVIAKALESEGNVYKKITDIGKIPFNDFCKPMLYKDDFKSDLCIMSIEERIKNWNRMFLDFK